MSAKSILVAVLAVATAGILQAGQRKPQKPQEPPPIAPLVVSRLLDTYAAGRFDDAVREVSRAPDRIGVNLRQHWSLDATLWIDAVPAERPRRLLVAAALALETEGVRTEQGEWGHTNGEPPCPGTCVLDWAQTRLVERGRADAAERAWYLAAASLAGGVRDWRYLQRALPPNAPSTLLAGLTERALMRFPGDPQIRLEQAIAASGRFTTTVDGGRLVNDPGAMVITMGPGGRSMAALPPREAAAALLEALVPDPSVGAEAQTRLGYLRWALGADEAAKQSLKQAAERATTNPDVQYLARFLLGWIALQAGKSDEAIPELQAALLARPDSQSAALALATLTLQRGEATQAYAMARASIDHRNTDDDPWRLFLYGHHPMLQARIAALRAELER
jgi:tetratricopeptide (TPR) repeat protein